MMLAFILASAGCSGAGEGIATVPAPVAADATPPVPDSSAWWREAGDPVLATLVQQGLDSSQEVACQVSGLRRYDHQVAEDARRIGARLGRLLGDKSVRPDPHARDERVERVVTRRARLARQIALAYVEVRRLQQDIALRNGLRDQYKDNAEVAQFRREAGLASAIDGALARSQDETAQGELGFAQGRLADAMGELARLVGDTPEALAAKLGAPGAIPDPPIDPLAVAPPEDPRRAALADGVLREARLTQALEEARRTVRDARGAYRQGAGAFSTLYVAEAAATAVDLALVDARAGRITATLDLWSGQDSAWARAGLAPVVAADPPATDATITVTAGCD
jgi:outer membrane protein TolC